MRTRRFLVASALAVAAALGGAAQASALVSVGHSGWQWSSPQPQGDTLRAMEFAAGGRGYAAGEFGTVLRTDDGGATWQGLPTGITIDLQRIRLIDSDSIVIGGGCLVRRSDDGGQTFQRIPWTPSEERCGAGVDALAFPSSDIGYLVLDDGSVLRTADGGRTFARRTSLPGTRSAPGGGTAVPTDVLFTTADIGFATTGGPSPGRIFRTTDAGASWSPVAEAGVALTSLNFADAQTAYATGAGGTLLRSTDAGATWAPVDAIGGAAGGKDLTSIHCFGTQVCLVTNAQGDRLVRTEDGGATWSSVSPSTEPIFAAAYSSATRAVGVGESGATVISDDAGVRWTPVGSRAEGEFFRVRPLGSDGAVVTARNGTLVRTTNGGETWTSIGVSTPEDIVDAVFPTPETGYALDRAGTVLRTDNAGASWAILDTGTAQAAVALTATDAETLILVFPTSIRRSADGGRTFTTVPTRGRRGAFVGLDSTGSLVAYGPRTILQSVNGGRAWRVVRSPTGRKPIAKVDFADGRTGYLLSSEGRLWTTSNTGRRWAESLALGTTRAFDLAAGTRRGAWVALNRFGLGLPSYGYVLRTSDGGRSWRPQLVANDPVSAIAAFGENGFLTTRGNRLLTTATGGDAGQASQLTLSTARTRISRATLRRQRNRITVRGRLRPAVNGDTVLVSMRSGGRWRSQVVQVSAAGTFTTTWTLTRSAAFVAQWPGDSDRRAAGSTALEVDVG